MPTVSEQIDSNKIEIETLQRGIRYCQIQRKCKDARRSN